MHVNKDEMATRHGGWGGAAAGAVVGLLFPPSIIGSALVGGAIGGVSGHLWRGMSRSDVKELGELIDAGEAALLVVGASTLEKALDEAGLKPPSTSASRSTRAPRTSTPRSRMRPARSAERGTRSAAIWSPTFSISRTRVTRSPDETQSDQMAAGGQGDRMTRRISVISRTA